MARHHHTHIQAFLQPVHSPWRHNYIRVSSTILLTPPLPLCLFPLKQFPIPEKRRKRLMQEFAEIERNIKRNR